MAPLALAYALNGQWAEARARGRQDSRMIRRVRRCWWVWLRARLKGILPLRNAISTAGADQGPKLRAQVLLVIERGGGDVGAVRAALDGVEID